MATFTWIPQYGASNEVKPSILKASFGDGYEQRVSNGINNAPRSWGVTFKEPPSEIDSIEAFLMATKNGDSFEWTPPRGSAGKWVCDSGWKREVSDPSHDTLTTTFREVFGEMT